MARKSTDPASKGNDPSDWPAFLWRVLTQKPMLFLFIAIIAIPVGLKALQIWKGSEPSIQSGALSSASATSEGKGDTVATTGGVIVDAAGAKAGGNIDVSVHTGPSENFEKLVKDSLPQDAHPVIDLSKPVSQQVQLFAEDTVEIVGWSDPIKEVKFGPQWEEFDPDRKYVVWGTIGVPFTPEFKGKGHLKLKVTFTRYRDQPRDLNETGPAAAP